jgi:hypothetical protein
MAAVKMATTLVTAVIAAQVAAVFKHETDRGPAVVITTMADAMATTLVIAVNAALATAMFKDMTGLVPNCSDR